MKGPCTYVSDKRLKYHRSDSCADRNRIEYHICGLLFVMSTPELRVFFLNRAVRIAVQLSNAYSISHSLTIYRSRSIFHSQPHNHPRRYAYDNKYILYMQSRPSSFQASQQTTSKKLITKVNNKHCIHPPFLSALLQ